MTFSGRFSPFTLVLLSSLLLTSALSGCGVGELAPATPLSQAGPSISGHIHGGQQPVVGAHVYLYGVRGDVGDLSMLGTDGLTAAL